MRTFGRRLAFVVVCLLLSATASAETLDGKVIEASTCAGLPGLTIRLIPPKGEPDDAEVITSTGAQGDFRVEARPGRYYLKIAQGVTQVYGDEVAAESGKQILISLRRTTGEIFSPFCLQGKAGAPLLKGVWPVGLAFLPSGMLVLSRRGNNAGMLWQARVGGFESVHKFVQEQAVDVATAEVEGKKAIFVLVNALGGGWLQMFSEGGDLKKQWPSGKLFTGFAVTATGTVYAVALQAQSNFQVLKIAPRWTADSKFETVANVYDPDAQIGPIAVDVAHNRLFVAGEANGHLYQADLTTHQSHTMHPNHELGPVRALALDATGRTLYVAAGRHVWKVQPDGAQPEVHDFPPGLTFRSAAALAIDEEGEVWVGDEGASVIYLLSPPAGQLVGTLH